MHQAWIFGSMLATGFALFGTAAWIEADRTAFTAPEAEPSIVTHVASSITEESKPHYQEDTPIMLEPVEIVARRPRPAARPVRLEPELATEPCSQWQELGPERVNDGNPIGVRRVRSLCLGPLVTLD
jgi:hypothetical protein